MWRSILLVALACTPRVTQALNYERFEQDGKVGIRDDQGRVIVPADFEALGWSDGSFSLIGEITGYRKGNRWGLLNLKKELITKADYISLTSAGGNFVRVIRETSAVSSKVGCINLKGEVIIPIIYDDLVLNNLRAIVMVKSGARYKYGLVDLTNRTILPPEYLQITPLGTLRFAVRGFEGKTALFTEEGKQVTAFDIDSLSSFQNDLAILHKSLRKGILDRNGSIRIEAEYGDARVTGPGTVQLKRTDTWKVVDHDQQVVRKIDADSIAMIGVNRYRLALNGKYGIVDTLFRIIVPVIYDYIGVVQNEQFVLGQHGRFGLMRIDGTMVLPIQFEVVMRDGHLLRVRTRESGRVCWDLYDTVGVRKTNTSYEMIRQAINGMYPVIQKGFAGAIDRTGVEKIACVYDSLLQIGEDAVAVKFKGLFGIVSRDDVWLQPPQPNRIKLIAADRYLEFHGSLKLMKDFRGQLIYFTDNPLVAQKEVLVETLQGGVVKTVSFNGLEIKRQAVPQDVPVVESFEEHEGLTRVNRHGKFGFVDRLGRLRIANRYEGAGDFHEGLAPVRLLGRWGFIDKSDQIVIQPAYDTQPYMDQGVAVVSRNNRVGIIGREGQVLLDLRYDSIRRMDASSFVLHLGGQHGLANGAGKILIEPRFDSIFPVGDDRVIVSQGGKYGVLTREGLSIFPLIYELLIYQHETKTFFARESFGWETVTLK